MFILQEQVCTHGKGYPEDSPRPDFYSWHQLEDQNYFQQTLSLPYSSNERNCQHCELQFHLSQRYSKPTVNLLFQISIFIIFTFLFTTFCSIRILYQVFRLTSKSNSWSAFRLTEFRNARYPSSWTKIEGILSQCSQQLLLPPFPLKSNILPAPSTYEWMIRSRLIRNNGPQLSIVPIFLFFCTLYPVLKSGPAWKFL